MRTLTTLFVLLLVTSSANAEIIELTYWEENRPHPLTLKISDTVNGLKLMSLQNPETPFSFGHNPRYRGMAGYWNDESDYYFEFRPVWHRHSWEASGVGIATPDLLTLQSGQVRREILNPSRVEAVRYVPEPSSLTLLALGGLLLAGTRRRNAGAWRGN